MPQSHKFGSSERKEAKRIEKDQMEVKKKIRYSRGQRGAMTGSPMKKYSITQDGRGPKFRTSGRRIEETQPRRWLSISSSPSTALFRRFASAWVKGSWCRSSSAGSCVTRDGFAGIKWKERRRIAANRGLTVIVLSVKQTRSARFPVSLPITGYLSPTSIKPLYYK